MRKTASYAAVILIIIFSCLGFVAAQNLSGGGEANPELTTNRQSLGQWRDLRFGMFIHWGPVSLRGTEIGWSRGREVDFEEYDQLYREFNPVLFDADKWVSIAREAGMKYLILVTRHHDGFTLWDSAHSEYDISGSPFERDVVRELSEACRNQGLLFGTYYSICDWHHPDYPYRYAQGGRIIEKDAADMKNFNLYLRGQLEELVRDYGSRIIWFDGEWEDPWTHEMGMDLYAWLRGLDDTLLINNRVDKGRRGMAGVSLSSRFAGDFETPEQEVGAFNTDTPWETCITIGKQWAWKPNDQIKSYRECLEILLQTVGGDGNLLLNVGPMPDGRIEGRQAEVLRRIGDWLEQYGEAVYGTRGGPVPPREWGVTTHKDKTIYVHLTDSQRKQVFLPGVRLVSAAGMDDGKNLEFENGKFGAVLETEGLTGGPFTVVKAEME